VELAGCSGVLGIAQQLSSHCTFSAEISNILDFFQLKSPFYWIFSILLEILQHNAEV